MMNFGQIFILLGTEKYQLKTIKQPHLLIYLNKKHLKPSIYINQLYNDRFTNS